MLDKIKDFFVRYQVEGVWFLIGYLVSDGFNEFGRGNYFVALFVWALAFVNFLLNKPR